MDLRISNKTIFYLVLIFILVFFINFLPGTASAATISRPPTNLGLVGYWSLDDGGGIIANDVSGNAHYGDITGATWTNGRRGKALNFDGIDDGVSLSSAGLNWSTYFSSSLDFTISAWIKPNSLGYFALVSQRYGDAMVFGMGDGVVFPAGRLFLNMDDTRASSPYSTGALTAGVWQHVTVTYTGSDASCAVTFYINGVSSGTGTSCDGNGIDPQDLLFLGYQTRTGIGGPDSYYSGQMDDVRLYNRALSASEVSSIYKYGQTTRKQVSNSGLVGYWSFNEGGGLAASDSSGNANTGTLTGTTLPTWTGGKRGKGLSFDGSTSNVSLSNSTSLSSLTSSFTITHWIKTTSSAAQMYTVGNTGGPDGYRFGLTSGYIAFLVGDGSYAESTCGSTAVNDGKWHMITGVYNRSGTLQFTCYVDGVFAANVSLSSAYPSMQSNAPGIGKPPCCTAFSGSLDDVRIYNRALSAAEISTLYKQNETKLNSSQNSKLTNGLVGLWSFDGADVSGSTAYDRSGNSNNGTIYGAAKVIGKNGQGLSFSGADYIEAAHTASMDVTALSIAMWIKTPESLCGAGVACYRALLSKQGADRDFNLYTYSGASDGNKVTYMHMSSARFGVTMPQLTTPYGQNEWHHVGFTVDSSGNYVHYSDGVSFASGSITAGANANSNYPIWIGRADNYYNGVIDEVRVYNRALSASEMKQLYLMGK